MSPTRAKRDRFTDDPSLVNEPAIIGGGNVVNGDWLQALAETACRATALAAVSMTAHDPHAASVLAAARWVASYATQTSGIWGRKLAKSGQLRQI